MVRKKYTIQKSFRLDEQLSRDLELLSELLQRPQNELYHMALEKFMRDNKYWFLTNMAYENFDFWMSSEIKEPEIILDLKDKVIICQYIDEDNIKLKLMDNQSNVIDEVIYPDLDDRIKSCLRSWCTGLDENSEEIQQYLKKRLDYR